MKKDKEQIKKNKEYLANIKLEKGCSRCGYKLHPAALEFHHVEDKKYNISRSVRVGVSREALDKEIKKCIILCANCHRVEHAR
jgi:hypothetical protein